MTPFECGQKNADLFIGFSCFLKEQAEKHGIEKLFFCTREGFFFKAVFDALFQEEREIETTLLYVSRQSVFPASILAPEGPDFSHLFRLYKTHSPKTFLGSLGLDGDRYSQFFESRGISMDELAESKSARRNLDEALKNAYFVERVSTDLREQGKSVRAYFDQEFDGISKIGLVDIGWRATVLAALGRLYPEKSFAGFFLGLAPERNTFGANCIKAAYGPDSAASKEYTNLLHAIDVIEFICMSDTPTTIGYKSEESGHMMQVPGNALDVRDSISRFSIQFQEGVISVARKTFPESLDRDYQSGALRERAMAHWRALVRDPPQELVDAFFALTSDEGFGLSERKDQSHAPKAFELLTALLVASRRNQIKRFLVYNQWAEGVVLRQDVGFWSRHFLYIAMKMAKTYKHLRSH